MNRLVCAVRSRRTARLALDAPTHRRRARAPVAPSRVARIRIRSGTRTKRTSPGWDSVSIHERSNRAISRHEKGKPRCAGNRCDGTRWRWREYVAARARCRAMTARARATTATRARARERRRRRIENARRVGISAPRRTSSPISRPRTRRRRAWRILSVNRVRAGEITRSRSNARGGEGRARARGDGGRGREEHFLEALARSEARRGDARGDGRGRRA